MPRTRTEEIEARLAELEEQKTLLFAEWAGIKSVELDAKMNALTEKDGDFTLETAMQVDLAYCGNSHIGETWWKMISEFLEKLTFGGVLNGLYRGGVNPDAGGQALFQIKLDRNHPLDEQKGLLAILPLINVVDGWKRFGLFESNGGGQFIRISENGETAEIWTHMDYRYRFEHGADPKHYKASFTGTVEELLAYVYAQHPYQWEKGSEEEDDDY
jgi:hypothetical protein